MHNKVKKNIHKSFSSSNVIESVDVNNSVVNALREIQVDPHGFVSFVRSKSLL